MLSDFCLFTFAFCLHSLLPFYFKIIIIMAISPELLNILRCPQCKSEVKIDAEETRLKCVNRECSLVYSIRDEIPVMLVEEATVEK